MKLFKRSKERIINAFARRLYLVGHQATGLYFSFLMEGEFEDKEVMAIPRANALGVLFEFMIHFVYNVGVRLYSEANESEGRFPDRGFFFRLFGNRNNVKEWGIIPNLFHSCMECAFDAHIADWSESDRGRLSNTCWNTYEDRIPRYLHCDQIHISGENSIHANYICELGKIIAEVSNVEGDLRFTALASTIATDAMTGKKPFASLDLGVFVKNVLSAK